MNINKKQFLVFLMAGLVGVNLQSHEQGVDFEASVFKQSMIYDFECTKNGEFLQINMMENFVNTELKEVTISAGKKLVPVGREKLCSSLVLLAEKQIDKLHKNQDIYVLFPTAHEGRHVNPSEEKNVCKIRKFKMSFTGVSELRHRELRVLTNESGCERFFEYADSNNFKSRNITDSMTVSFSEPKHGSSVIKMYGIVRGKKVFSIDLPRYYGDFQFHLYPGYKDLLKNFKIAANEEYKFSFLYADSNKYGGRITEYTISMDGINFVGNTKTPANEARSPKLTISKIN